MYCNGLLRSPNTTWNTVWNAYKNQDKPDEKILKFLTCAEDFNALTLLTKMPEDFRNVNLTKHLQHIVVYFHIIEKQAAYGSLLRYVSDILNNLKSHRYG